MLSAEAKAVGYPVARERAAGCRVAVIWIDWYAYHIARFQGLLGTSELGGKVAGIEMVGGVGVHAGLSFRETAREGLGIETLVPDADWAGAGQLRLARAVWRRLSELGPELVLVPGYYTLPALAAALWAKVHRRKSVLMTESTEGDHPRSWWKERAKSVLIRGLFGWTVTGGDAHARYLRRLGFAPERIAGFYDVVDNSYYAREARALRAGSRAGFELPENYFLYVGRLAEEKNVRGLVRAYLAYRQAGGSWSLVLAGGGGEEEPLRALAAPSPFGRDIHFAGHKTTRELPPLYAFAGAFVLPSLREPWGLVVNEAMASGLPVIVSSRCGCVADLVGHGENGLVFDPRTPGELAGCLRAMEEAGEERRQAMRRAGEARISLYSPESWGREISRVLRA